MKSKLWLVARHEYARHVFKKSFVALLLSVPLVLAVPYVFSSPSVMVRSA